MTGDNFYKSSKEIDGRVVLFSLKEVKKLKSC